MDLRLLGSLVLETAVGCPSDCGPHGQCWPSGNGTDVACVCECGWAGECVMCTILACPFLLQSATCVKIA